MQTIVFSIISLLEHHYSYYFAYFQGLASPIYWQMPFLVLCTEQLLSSVQERQQSFQMNRLARFIKPSQQLQLNKDYYTHDLFYWPIILNVWPGLSSLLPWPTHYRPTYNDFMRGIMPWHQEASSPCCHICPIHAPCFCIIHIITLLFAIILILSKLENVIWVHIHRKKLFNWHIHLRGSVSIETKAQSGSAKASSPTQAAAATSPPG